jgi:hypothetical protein
MRHRLLKYRRSTGEIVGVWTSSDPALLDLQLAPEDPEYAGYQDETADEEARPDVDTLRRRYRIHEGRLTRQAETEDERPPASPGEV